jgi:hypothetical protein
MILRTFFAGLQGGVAMGVIVGDGMIVADGITNVGSGNGLAVRLGVENETALTL